ncbi:MAG: Uncharacterised protein [SAR116 cluster bacterium]|nr:MAG: Uncharacterised protein [SAR116 cluster bacterium]
MRCAASSSGAPATSMVISFEAPSPSRTIWMARSCITWSSALTKSSNSGSSTVVGAWCAATAVATRKTLSLVEVSLSTVMALKLRRGAVASKICRMGAGRAASVATKPSMVAIFGAIMPDPLAMPAMVTGVSPIMQLALAPFANVSVVMMAEAASCHEALSCLTNVSNSAARMAASSGSPITPVEATMMASGAQPRERASAVVDSEMVCLPAAPVKALALPALTRMAEMAVPSASRSRDHSTGGAAVSDCVNTAASVLPSAQRISIRSSRPAYFSPVAAVPSDRPAIAGMSGNVSGTRRNGVIDHSLWLPAGPERPQQHLQKAGFQCWHQNAVSPQCGQRIAAAGSVQVAGASVQSMAPA